MNGILNYHSNVRPNLPQPQVVKEMEYCTSAMHMVVEEIWKVAEGFAESPG